MVVIEPEVFVNVASLLSKKEKIEHQLMQLDSTSQSESEKFYSLREEVSRIEEAILRSSYECEKLNSQ